MGRSIVTSTARTLPSSTDTLRISPGPDNGSGPVPDERVHGSDQAGGGHPARVLSCRHAGTVRDLRDPEPSRAASMNIIPVSAAPPVRLAPAEPSGLIPQGRAR